MKYRKKPVVIEAVELNRRYFEQALNFIDKDKIDSFCSGEFSEDSCYITIKTLEGNMLAEEGDFIIKGIKGEFYPIKNDIFLETYEKVEDT